MKNLLIKVNSNERLKNTFSVLSCAAVISAVLSFILIMTINFAKDLKEALIIGISSAAAFVTVTVIRKIINAKRPYEVYDFYKERPKNKAGMSFPSRHVFSIFLIATIALSVSLIAAIALYIIGILLAAFRVLLGIHFIRDVLCGAALGVIGGVCPLVIIHII